MNSTNNQTSNDDGNNGPDKNVVYLVLVLLVVGLLFFICNWIRCMLKKPRLHEEDLEDLRIIEMSKNKENENRRLFT